MIRVYDSQMVGTPFRHCVVPIVSILVSFALEAAPPSDISIKVHVRGPGGTAVRDAYVAVIPEWRPWSRPLVETIATEGLATYGVPPGTYYISAGAKGAGSTVQGPVTIASNSAKDFTLALTPLRKVSGTVLDDRGNPIEGARVSDLRAAVPPPLDVVSDLTLQHLGSEWKTKTGRDGSWTLMLPQMDMPLVIEARGKAPLLRSYHPGDEAALTTVLQQGATLRLTLDRVAPDMILTLRQESGSNAGVLQAWQPKVWARWASTTTLEWDSLPAGDYRVQASYPDPLCFAQKSFELPPITLSAGQAGEAAVILPSAISASQHEVALFVPKLHAKDFEEGLETFGVAASGAPRRTSHFVEDVIGGTVIHFRVDETHKPFYAATADRFLASSVGESEADGGSHGVPLRASVHPRADAHLIVRSAEKELLVPPAGMALLHECGRLKKTDPPVEILVPIEISGQDLARFTAPAGCTSAVLSFDPLEPVIVETPLKPGEQSLGMHILRGAGLADVRVTSDGAFVVGATVLVKVAGAEYPERESIVVGGANTSQDGWAHLPRLPVFRTLQVTAETSRGERSDNVDLRLEPRGHTVVDPLPVLKPASLTVEAKIADEVRATFPSARLTTIWIRPGDKRRDSSEDQQQSVRDENVPSHFDSLHPGKWFISGNVSVASTYSMIRMGEVTLKSGEAGHYGASVKPLIFHGRIAQAGRGVAARMTLTDLSGSPTEVQQHCDSSQDGSFHAVLPHAGMYRAEVARLAAQGDVIPLGVVDFMDPAQPIKIDLPTAAKVVVQVVSGNQPVPNADVVAMIRRQDMAGVETFDRSPSIRSDGRVTFDDLIQGPWTFVAREIEGHRVAERTVDVGAEGELDVKLDLKRASSIEGAVRDSSGVPMAYSRVDCVFAASNGLPGSADANADSEGKFNVVIDDDSPVTAICSVVAPTGHVDAFRARSGDRLDATIGLATATLTIEDWSTRWSPGAFWLTSADGRVISLSAVAGELGRAGGPLRIPALTAGQWRVVRIATASQWLSLSRGFTDSLPVVARFSLEAGATLVTRIYSKPSEGGGSQ
jgi:hypothetical protein